MPIPYADRARIIADEAKQHNAGGSLFIVEEILGGDAIKVELSGSCGVKIGAMFTSRAKGGKYIPFGQTRAISVITGIDYDETEFELDLDGAYMGLPDVTVTNAENASTPEGLVRLFERLQARGREVRVELGQFARRGIIREVKAAPGRAYSTGVQEIDGPIAPPAGFNVGLTVKVEWTGRDVSLASTTAIDTGDDVAGALGAFDSQLASSLAAGGAFEPNFLDQITNMGARLRAGVNKLRRDLKRVGDLAKLPAKTANSLLAAARSVSNLVNDFNDTVHGIGDEYKAVGDTASAMFGAKRQAGAASSAANGILAQALRIIDAIGRRKARVVGVRPGMSLAVVAQKELGRADRWPEIAAHNEIAGQVVPVAVFTIEIPAGG